MLEDLDGRLPWRLRGRSRCLLEDVELGICPKPLGDGVNAQAESAGVVELEFRLDDRAVVRLHLLDPLQQRDLGSAEQRHSFGIRGALRRTARKRQAQPDREGYERKENGC